MANFKFRVDPNVVQARTEEFGRKITAMQTAFSSILRTAKNTSGYWIGDAGNKEREGYNSFEDTISEIIKALDKDRTDLYAIAQTYGIAAGKAKETAGRLSVDNLP